MAFPNISDILATTIESRTRQIADNVTKNNAILMKLSGVSSLAERSQCWCGASKVRSFSQ